MTANRRDFYSATSKAPCIIMSHGFSGIKLQNLNNFAQRFQGEGWNTLIHDNRNVGGSNGLPGNEIDLTYQVDPTKIAYWGTSLLGGNVICAAAIDKRIKAAIPQTPFVSGEIHTKPLVKTLPAIFANRAGIRDGNPSATIPISPESLEEAESGRSIEILNSPAAFDFMEDMKKIGGNWKNEVTLQSMFNLMANEPKSFIHRIAPTAFLMIVVDDNEIPKQIHVVKGYSHFGVHSSLGLQENIKVRIDFLRKNL
ncbi:alpha/beta superfamily hydrolase [Acephala macrosclerotiorum]|nr:alpha/beta superfamily hydrolase [Acephala macrosclerotiorum]